MLLAKKGLNWTWYGPTQSDCTLSKRENVDKDNTKLDCHVKKRLEWCFCANGQNIANKHRERDGTGDSVTYS